MIGSTEGISRPALLLVAGRSIGFAASFLIPIILVRTFNQEEFGTYKQLFLIYATLYGLAQIGMAESLYFFVPQRPAEAGPLVANTLLTLGLAGGASLALLLLWREAIAGWLSNPALTEHLGLLGLMLVLTLVTAGFEIIMVAQNRHLPAAVTYGASDLLRTALLVAPAFLHGELRAVLWGGVAFAAVRLVVMLAWLRKTFGAHLKPDRRLWRYQLAYALPFAMAVGLEVLQINLHQYVVAARFDAVTFAIYAVGCLQIPLVDLATTSAANVMMVRIAEGGETGREGRALSLWHHTVSRLALLVFPLTVVLVLLANHVIVLLFTTAYAASAPIFVAWTLTILPAVLCVDAVLRAFAETRFLMATNLLRLVLVIALISWCISAFGLIGAVIATLAATTVVRIVSLMRIAALLRTGVRRLLPWRQLAGTAACALAAAVPAYALSRSQSWPVAAVLLAAGTLYWSVYAGLVYGAFTWQRRRAAAVVAPAPLTT